MKSDKAVYGLREVWFWAGVFRDHARFIHDHLGPKEEQEIRWARGFTEAFERLHTEAEQLARRLCVPGPAGSYALEAAPTDSPLAHMAEHELRQTEQQVERLCRSALEVLTSLRAFKEKLLQQQLDCTITLSLGPTLLAHMIVEAEEGQRVLSGVREGAPLPPALESLHHHLIWLPDASGHAVALNNGLDGPEQVLREATERFHHIFDGMHIKALELYSMLRVAPRMVGALKRLNKDSVSQIATFRAFLEELREHLEGCELLTTLMPLMADHMLREELYYTEKIMAIHHEEQRSASVGHANDGEG